MTAVAEVATCSLPGRAFLEWRSQSYHLSTVYFNWLETTQEQQKLDKVIELRKQLGCEPALPSVKSPACTWHRLQTSKQVVTSRSFPSLHMPFFKICHCLKSSLSWAGLHKQITCEEKTTSRVKSHAEKLISEHFLKTAEQCSQPNRATPLSVLHLNSPSTRPASADKRKTIKDTIDLTQATLSTLFPGPGGTANGDLSDSPLTDRR